MNKSWTIHQHEEERVIDVPRYLSAPVVARFVAFVLSVSTGWVLTIAFCVNYIGVSEDPFLRIDDVPFSFKVDVHTIIVVFLSGLVTVFREPNDK